MKHHLLELEAKAIRFKSAGRNAEAAELFSLIVKEQPDWEHGTAAHFLAQCYEDCGQLDLAEQNYLEALKYEPANDILLGGFASFLYLHGDPQEAFGTYLKLLNLYQPSSEAAKSCIVALEALGEKIGWSTTVVAARIEESRTKPR